MSEFYDCTCPDREATFDAEMNMICGTCKARINPDPDAPEVPADGGTLPQQLGDLRAENEEFKRHLDDLEKFVLENVALRAKLAAVEALCKPAYDRTEGQTGTHSTNCYEYHIGCLAASVTFAIRSQEPPTGQEQP